jgi:hypothetical protein
LLNKPEVIETIDILVRNCYILAKRYPSRVCSASCFALGACFQQRE